MTRPRSFFVSLFAHSQRLAMFGLVTLTVLLLTNPASAQWSSEGVPLIDWFDSGWSSCPDGEGGAWYAQNYGNALAPQLAVQHIDSDGYTSFGQEGVIVSDSVGCTLLGVEPGLDGDCIVMFIRSVHGEQDRVLDLYAQKITQQGERLWGQGILASATESYRKWTPGSYAEWTLSDDAGGAWVLWCPDAEPLTDVYVGGINADGTLKYPNGDRLIGESRIGVTTVTPKGLRISDGEGGLVVMLLQHVDNYSIRHILLQHIYADGSFQYDDPQLVLDWPDGEINSFDKPFYIKRDPLGGYVITTRWYWQRISNDLVAQWDIRGVQAYDFDFEITAWSESFVFADRSIVQFAVEAYEDRIRIEQMDMDGNRVAGSGWGPYAGDTIYYPTGFDPLVLAPDRQSVIVGVRGRLVASSSSPLFRLVQRVTASGDNLWPQVTQFGDENDNAYASPWSAIYLNDDEHLCYMLGDGVPQDYRRHYAYKLNASDGSVFDESYVAENPALSNTSPETPAMISNAYPNPFNSSIALTISVRDPGVYDLIVRNVLGQMIHREAVDNRTPGEFVQTLTLPDGSASGICFLTLQHTDGRNLSQKKVVYLR